LEIISLLIYFQRTTNLETGHVSEAEIPDQETTGIEITEKGFLIETFLRPVSGVLLPGMIPEPSYNW
jgi:hypothetical protein